MLVILCPPPPPVREGQCLCSGRMRVLPITAGDQGDPPGGNDTASSPPGVGDDAGFTLDSSASGPRTTLTCVADAGYTLASSASGPHTTDAGCTTDAGFTLASSASGTRTTPTRLVVVVEGTPLRVMQAVRTLPRRKRMTPHPSWIFRQCWNSLQPLLQRVTWLLLWLPTQWRLFWQQ